MIENLQVRVKPDIAYTPLKLQLYVADTLGGIDINRIKEVKITRRSIDARQRQVMVNLSLKIFIDEQPTDDDNEWGATAYRDVSEAPSVIIVGAGPAGLFAALKLIELGLKPIIFERGKNVDERRKDMALISRENIVDPDSNYCFGEGGAGAFSDGKLYTRSKKRGSIEGVLKTLYIHGAPKEVLVDAHPHIGTDRLPEVIKAIRNTIIQHGGEVHFSSKVTDLIMDGNEVRGIVTADGNEHIGTVILATGHSARDVYRMLQRLNIAIEPKGIAVGVRLEHPQQLIDKIIYHNPNGRGKFLPPAEYTMSTRCDGRGVYSFCMCPGGFIIPSASGPNQQAVNGMSPGNRGTRWANSGMVVEILPEDLTDYDEYGDLKVLKFQEEIEKRFFDDSDGTQNAPAQRMTDFVTGRMSKDLPDTSYAPGIHPSRLDILLPDFIAKRLRDGFKEFGSKYKGFLSDEACLIGAETRTSSPIRVIRDPLTLAHVTAKGLFPCGEGAGYAGGIVSAAIDGERCAQAAFDYLNGVNPL